ncbi:MAG: 3-oxoacyl-ACP reductase FabG [Bacteroidota bacterium]
MKKGEAWALVSGASRGIGRAIALQLATDHGLPILINYAQNHEAAAEALASLEAAGGKGALLPVAVEDKAAVDIALENWQEEHPDAYIGVLVNNAGIARDGLLMWMKEEDWDDVLNVSVKGMYNLSRAVIRSMLRRRRGRIINITSLSGAKGLPGQMNYSAAKAAMIGATKALAQEVGKRHITVNAVAPGFIDTDMLAEAQIEGYLPHIPLQRLGQAEEVAHLVSFLASEKAAYITGEVIHINGGLYS